jgi:hypothetical protein
MVSVGVSGTAGGKRGIDLENSNKAVLTPAGNEIITPD